ncbi:hypothetical protein M434DRAFT_33941 [Hypoxylon sp. CO27-5]|nr:hypothetical protein M434DRAFT_33941 [Hypoxylon sp. CO27-5]
MEPKSKKPAMEATWYSFLATPVFTAISNEIMLLYSFWDILYVSFVSWVYSVIERYQDDNKMLESISQESCQQSVVFVSISVYAWDIDRTKITDIGTSTWSPSDFKFDPYSCHWRIKENMGLENRYMPNEPDTFTFGSTVCANETNITSILEEAFTPLFPRFQRVVIVGHGIYSTLELLRNYWKPPACVTILDTQKIWQLQCRQSENITLEGALTTIMETKYDNYLLHNAGNDSYFALCLLRAEGGFGHHSVRKDPEKHTQPPENSKF